MTPCITAGDGVSGGPDPDDDTKLCVWWDANSKVAVWPRPNHPRKMRISSSFYSVGPFSLLPLRGTIRDRRSNGTWAYQRDEMDLYREGRIRLPSPLCTQIYSYSKRSSK